MKKKAFVLTLDATIAIIVVMTILLIANFYIAKAKGPTLTKTQLIKRGSDLTFFMEKKGTFDTFSKDLIEGNLSDIKPPRYNIHFNIYNRSTLQAPITDLGISTGSERSTGSGRIIAVRTQNNKIHSFYSVRYYVWPE